MDTRSKMYKLINENDKYLIQAKAAAQCLMDNGPAIELDINTVDGLTWMLYDRLEDLSRLSEKMMEEQYRKGRSEAVKSSQTQKDGATDSDAQAPKWKVTSSTPRNVDDLLFTSRNSEGEICWWNPPALTSDDPLAHEGMGRACAYDLLKLIHNSAKTEELDKHTISYITSEIERQDHTMNAAIYKGFFEMISEHLIDSTGDR